MYTRKKFGLELKEHLTQGFDIEEIAKWADRIHYSDKNRELTPELKKIVDALSFMTMDIGFEFTETELTFLVDKLINNEENSLNEILRMRDMRYT